jgi:hypothetical protein
MSTPLTLKQQYWFDHITAAQQNSQALSDYAALHNLSTKALYNWRWTFSKKAQAPVSKKSAFVKIIPPAISANKEPDIVIFPNGIRLQLSALTPALLAMLLQC